MFGWLIADAVFWGIAVLVGIGTLADDFNYRKNYKNPVHEQIETMNYNVKLSARVLIGAILFGWLVLPAIPFALFGLLCWGVVWLVKTAW